MKEIQKRELLRCVGLIKGLGCSFKIITPEGEEFGELEIKTSGAGVTRGPRKYPYGTLTAHARGSVDLTAPVGSVQVIPCDQFDTESVRSAVCTLLTNKWGPKTYVTSGHADHIDVLRTAEEGLND